MSKKNLIIDVGNTATKFAIFIDENLQEFLGFFRLPDELDVLKKALKSLKKAGLTIDGGMIFSVVPIINCKIQKAVYDAFGVKLPIFDWHRYELDNKHPEVNEAIGADLLADIKQAAKEYGGPALIADFGTITKLLYIDEKCSFEGLSMIPGLEATMKSFSSHTALLPKKVLANLPKDRLGLNTEESMIHGAYWSNVYYVKEVFKSLNNENIKLIITGGNSRYVKNEFLGNIIDTELTLKGMNILYQETLKWIIENI